MTQTCRHRRSEGLAFDLIFLPPDFPCIFVDVISNFHVVNVSMIGISQIDSRVVNALR